MEKNEIRLKAQGEDIDKLISRLVVEAVRNEDVRRIVMLTLGVLLENWSRKSYLKKKIAGRVEKTVYKVLAEIAEGETELYIWKDPVLVPAVAQGVTLLVNGIFTALTGFSENSDFSPEDNVEFLASVMRGIDINKLGAYLTMQAKSLGDLMRRRPEFAAEILEGPFNGLVESVDFGELKDTFDSSDQTVAELSRMINEVLWRYPAKAVCLIGCLLPLVNGGIRAVHETVRPFNNLAPELLADVAFSLLRLVNGREIGMLANSAMELVRKLHTGSYLLGEAGLPQFYTDLKPLLQEIVSTIDPALYCKTFTALAEDGETVARALAEVVAENPGLYTAMISSYASRKNPKIRAARMRLSLHEEFPEEEVAGAVSSGVADIDTQEIGEMINSALRFINTVYKHKPAAIPQLLSEIVLAVDADEIRTAADNVIGDVVGALKPVAGAVMPSIIRGLCDLLTPDPDEESGEFNDALSSLRKILVREGSAK